VAETLSACIIARDEEERLPDCLASLEFCDEVVVVDSGSTDRTREIARAAGAVVVENPWPGFAAQRNVALDHAGGDWVIEVDADERVSPQLAREVRELVDRSPAERIAAIPIRHRFLGRALGPSARYPGYRHRLFRRASFRHDESRAVHEGLWPDGPTVPLAGDLTHVLASTWSEALADAFAYARLESHQRGRPSALQAAIGIALRPVAKFGYRIFLYGGWRDGWRGVAKVGLDCLADSLAQALATLDRAPRPSGAAYGQEAPRLGPVRLVGVAISRRGAGRLEAWLAEAAAEGADVALVARWDSTLVRGRRLDGAGPGALVRALDAEDQLRPIDALVPAGQRERLLLRIAPRALRGASAPLDPSGDPAATTVALQGRSRSGLPSDSTTILDQ
jgi:hypothetical protein